MRIMKKKKLFTILYQHRGSGKRFISLLLAILVAASTSYQMMLPALGMDEQTVQEDPAVIVETPTPKPTEAPTAAPTEAPTAAPTEAPTAAPADEPTAAPADEPTAAPAEEPETRTAGPTEAPTEAPQATRAPEVTPVPYPAVTLKKDLSEKFFIEVKALEGALPFGAKLEFRYVEKDEYRDEAAVRNVLGESMLSIRLFELYFTDAGGTRIQPLKKVRVSLRTESIAEAKEDARLYYIDINHGVEFIKLLREITKKDELTFETKKFNRLALTFIAHRDDVDPDELTEEPEIISEPTDEPEVTGEPENTPEPSGEPEVTEAPDSTEAPDVTPTPENTDDPTVFFSEDPETTDDPDNTPVPSGESETTDEPEVTAEPTDEPETADEPDVTPDPEATEDPENTPDPESADDPDATPDPEAAGDPAETCEPPAMPAVSFTETIGSLTVEVEAEEGAFPEGTTMVLEPITSEEILSALGDAVDGVVAEVRAVDITFLNADGEEIEPLREIRVVFRDEMIAAAERVEVVHLDSENNTSVVTQDPEITGCDEVVFSSETFSIYGYVSVVISDTILTSSGETYRVTVSCSPEAGIPSGAELSVRELTDEEKEAYAALAADALSLPPDFLAYLRLLDISILFNGEEQQPSVPVDVTVELDDAAEDVPMRVIHFGEEPEAVAAEASEGSVSFSAEGFSIYAIVGTVIEKTVTASDGQSYSISVTYGSGAGVPKGAELAVDEIPDDSEEYYDYIYMARDALGWTEGMPSYARVFDIRIVDAEGNKVEIAAPVKVKIELADRDDGREAHIVHFADGSESGDVVENTAKSGEPLTFSAEGFSAYAIVEGPDPVPLGWDTVSSLNELVSLGSQGLYIGHVDGYYMTSGITQISGSRTGITKTKPAQSYPASAAVKYYFEPVSGSSDRFRVCCVDGGTRKYVIQSGNSLNFTDAANATEFTVEPTGSGDHMFRLKGSSGFYWNMQAGATGASIAAYQSADDPNARFYFWYLSDVPNDPYHLHNKTYGLITWNDGPAGKAMMASSSSENHLDAQALTVMTKSGTDSDNLLVPKDTDISMWTFEYDSADRYYLKASTTEGVKYLKITSAGLTLVSDREDAGSLQVVPGTGIHKGEICLKSDEATLTYSGNVNTGYSTGGGVGSEWLNLAELSELTSDYFRTYSARKISISDPNVSTGDKVVVYTRSWSEEELKYKFYALGPDGTVVPCFETGDSIEWVGGQFNELLWQFTEYENDDGSPTGYYELYNEYSRRFLAPQVTGGQILSSDTIGLNIIGRQNGQYYSQIVAWDDPHYTYAGLKVENGQLVTCPKSEALDFYFAIVEDLPVDDVLHTVPTVDHTQYGITMRIKDFDTRAEMSNFLGSDAGGMGGTLHQGLLSTGLGADGFPTAAGGSLGSLYSGAKEVNHLFISSIYYASGYYEFDSTQNNATLGGNTGGNFTVYKEIATHDASNKDTLKHGQFYPFNDIEAGLFASVNGRNLYTATAHPLPDGDPRKNEQLYLIKNPDYYFGVELEAGFTQTPSGKDAWGHDIIFEFTGDDDFWLYVDGELVIDLGGIHSAVPGNVNFRTGAVNVNGTRTTLKDLFYSNYLGRGHTEAEAQAYVDAKFVQNAEGNWVFKDYSNHTMRIFYMERGASASNLHMRFNLAAVKKGTVLLSKDLEGVDDDSVYAEFPYQITYINPLDGREYYLKNTPSGSDPDDHVFYEGTSTPVTYRQSLTIDGIEYNDVFLLKPGETAEIVFPEYGTDHTPVTSYSIKECCVNTDVYSGVKINDAVCSGDPVEGRPNRSDFSTGHDTIENRARVRYTNAVRKLNIMTVTKRLYDESGETEILTNTTPFSFRLYLGTEFDDELTLANMHPYCVKEPEPEGCYCLWDDVQQRFVSLGKTDFGDLTEEERNSAVFHTSIYGQISKIPSRYTVEIRDILPGTQFRLVERANDIPDGYSFQKYEYNGAFYDDEEEGVHGSVSAEGRHDVTVRNLKGWGLRVNKIWTDADYMAERDAAYFAVFTLSDSGVPTLVDGTVRRMAYGPANTQTQYWYFERLTSGIPLDRYVVREVTLSAADPTVDANGAVTDYGTATPVEDGGTVALYGKQKGETNVSLFDYTVTYAKGQIPEDSNVRVDTVTNDRPGIVLKKSAADFSVPLAGAVFTLKDDAGDLIGTFTSGEDGLITVAYLRENREYILTEISAPQGYHGLQTSLTIVQSPIGVTVTPSDAEENLYRLEQGENIPATLTVRNRPYTFEALKLKGSLNGAPLPGVHFELHRWVSVGGHEGYDINPMIGYEDLVSGENGVIPLLDSTLEPDRYELQEKAPPSGYQPLPAYIHFKVSATGEITLEDAPYGVTLNVGTAADGSLVYTLTVMNYTPASVELRKTDDNGDELAGALFALCRREGNSWAAVKVNGRDDNVIDMTSLSAFMINGLEAGWYRIEETHAPDGYVTLIKFVYFTLDADGTVRLTDENGNPIPEGEGGQTVYGDITLHGKTISVKNHSGAELPHTGGPGVSSCHVPGALLTLLASALFIIRRRRRHA